MPDSHILRCANCVLLSSLAQHLIAHHLKREKRVRPYLSRVDLLAGEGIVVGAHIGGCVDCVSCRIRCLPKSLMGKRLIFVVGRGAFEKVAN